jgi:hypothetical protein
MRDLDAADAMWFLSCKPAAVFIESYSMQLRQLMELKVAQIRREKRDSKNRKEFPTENASRERPITEC